MDKPGLVDWAILPLTWLERARGWKRFGLFLLYFLTSVLVGVIGWRESIVWRLPAIGEPFDVDRLGNVAVADANNAMVLYEKASKKLIAPTQMNYKPTAPKAWEVADWQRADPEVRRWVTDNRPAFDEWFEATERSDSLLVQPRDFGSKVSFQVPIALLEFSKLARLEASRLEDDGDLAGAWKIYRASLRASRHVGRHGSSMLRNLGLANFNLVRTSIERWAGDPRVTPTLLRQAVADVETCQRMTSPNSERVLADYFVVRSILDDLKAFGRYEKRKLGDEWAWLDQITILPDIERFVTREPDRSRRILDLIIAGQLAQCDRPRLVRPELASGRYPIFEVDDKTPKSVAAIIPKDLEAWANSSMFAEIWGGTNGWTARLEAEAGMFDTLALSMAERAYLLENSRPPKTYGDLLGKYLLALPEGIGAADLITAEPSSR